MDEAPPREPIVSSAASDPLMDHLVDGYVRQLGITCSLLSSSIVAGNTDALRRLAHDLAGTAQPYGFPLLSERARTLEEAVRGEAPLEDVLRAADALLDVVERAALPDPVDRAGQSQPVLIPMPMPVPPFLHTDEPARVLVIDDDPAVHELLSVHLASDDLVLDFAADGDIGIASVLADPPDLILLDLHLPGRSGLDICEVLKRTPAVHSVPVIFLTVSADPQAKLAAFEAGGVDYIVKPFLPSELNARVQSALRTGRYLRLLATRALVDPLTGLWNRTYLDGELGVAGADHRRRGRAYAVMMIDLDHFKRVNDTHGHVFGDRVLRRVARLLKGALRETDVACRYGGEEFAAVLRDTSAPDAEHVAARFRRLLHALRLTVDGAEVTITASIGIASAEADGKATSPVELLERADRALYRAKSSGRDQVCIDVVASSRPGAPAPAP